MYNIMLVDDDRVVRYHLKKMGLWEEHGFVISDEAVDGYEALKKISSSHFDMAFVDIKMPRIDGIEFLRELRENKKDLCVVFMSGYSDFAYAKQGIVLGAFDYIVKPVDEANLCDVLSRATSYIYNKKEEEALKSKLSPLVDKILNRSCSINEIGSVAENLHLDNKDPVIRRLCQYVLLHSDEKISLESVSDELGFSSCYLGKLFKKKAGEGFTEYVTKIKMERAKALLRAGKYKIYEISNILCYGDADYFCSLFKRYAGVTPVKYRQSVDSDRECE